MKYRNKKIDYRNVNKDCLKNNLRKQGCCHRFRI